MNYAMVIRKKIDLKKIQSIHLNDGMFNVLIFADPDTRVVISLSCFFGGSLIGIGVLVIVKRFKTYKRMWVFD